MSDEILEQQVQEVQEKGEQKNEEVDKIVDEQNPQKQESDKDLDTEKQPDVKEKNKEKKESVPETYDYSAVKLPEGIQLDKDILGEFEPIAKKMNLSQEQANEFVNLAVKLVGKQSNEMLSQLQKVQEVKAAQYQQLLNTDKEIGNGDKAKMDAYLDVADIGYSAFANEEVKGLLAESGLNYHPEIVKMFHRIGELCKEDTLPNASYPTGKGQSAAEVLYGSNEE